MSNAVRVYSFEQAKTYNERERLKEREETLQRLKEELRKTTIEIVNLMLEDKDFKYHNDNLYDDINSIVEEAMIGRVMRLSRFNQTKTARILGVSRGFVINRIKSFCL